MTIENLTATLATRIMGWGTGPDRFLLGERRWLSRWRFQPAVRLEDAFRLLERLAPEECTMGATPNGGFWVKIRVAGKTGEASETSKARAVTFAIARAVGIDVDSVEEQKQPVASRTTGGRR
jgi:hypothetical protein